MTNPDIHPPKNPTAMPKRPLGRPLESYSIEQRSKRLAQWPRQDREAWEMAISQGVDLLDAAGHAAHLRKVTQLSRAAVWGRFLNFLDLAGELDDAAAPASRPTDDRIRRWIGFLEQCQRASAVHRMLIDLSTVAAAMMPGRDWSWIRRHKAGPTASVVRASRKPIETFDPILLDRRLRERLATLQDGPRTLLAALEVRDLTMVRLGLYTGLRCMNLVMLRLGQQLHDRDGQFMIYLEASETKTNRPMDLIVAPTVTPTLRAYIDEWRPLLLRGRVKETALWLTWQGNIPVASTGHRVFQRVTLALIDRACNPHLVRHTMATELLISDPTAVRMAGAALGHVDGRSVNEVYDRSGAAGAHRLWKKLLAQQLRRGRNGNRKDKP